jgi:uncharacterized protein YndB with AHSA1/START domain
MNPSNSVTISVTVQAPLAKVWECWTEPSHITQWNFAIDTWQCPWSKQDLRVGGRLESRMEAKDGSMGFEFGGIYTAVEPLQRLAFTMDDNRAVEVHFSETAEGVLLTETFEVEDMNSVEMQRDGWQAILQNFKTHTESC